MKKVLLTLVLAMISHNAFAEENKNFHDMGIVRDTLFLVGDASSNCPREFAAAVKGRTILNIEELPGKEIPGYSTRVIQMSTGSLATIFSYNETTTRILKVSVVQKHSHAADGNENDPIYKCHLQVTNISAKSPFFR